MSEVFLDGFDVVAALDRSHCVSMPQIMEKSPRQAELSHHALEAIIHGAVRKVAAGLIGKDQVVVHPLLPRIHHHQRLSLLLLSPQLNNRRCKNDDTDLAVLGGGEAKQEGKPAAVIAYADKANERLRRKYTKIASHSKYNIAKTAVARELACFIWGMMTDNIA